MTARTKSTSARGPKLHRACDSRSDVKTAPERTFSFLGEPLVRVPTIRGDRYETTAAATFFAFISFRPPSHDRPLCLLRVKYRGFLMEVYRTTPEEAIAVATDEVRAFVREFFGRIAEESTR